MKREALPPIKEIYRALEDAALDLYGFAVSCQGGVIWAAEPQILEILWLGLENVWFVEDAKGNLGHLDFREDFFRALWVKVEGQKVAARIGTDVPLGHDEMAFYQLPQFARAALFLRTKKKFPYATVARILGSTESLVYDEVEKAREFLLGRRLRSPEWTEEEF